MANQWATKAAQKLKEQDEQRKLQQATQLRELDLIRKSVALLWNELKKRLQESATDFNEEYGQSYLMVLPGGTPDNLFVQSPKRKVEMRYNNTVPEITFTPSFEQMGWLRFGVENGEVVFIWDGPRFSVTRTAEIILERFV